MKGPNRALGTARRSKGPARRPSVQGTPRSRDALNQTSVSRAELLLVKWRKSYHSRPTVASPATASVGRKASALSRTTSCGGRQWSPASSERATNMVEKSPWSSNQLTYTAYPADVALMSWPVKRSCPPVPGSTAFVNVNLAASTGADQVLPWSVERIKRIFTGNGGGCGAEGSAGPSTKTSRRTPPAVISSWFCWASSLPL